jgi:hypothetical protein
MLFFDNGLGELPQCYINLFRVTDRAKKNPIYNIALSYAIESS